MHERRMAAGDSVAGVALRARSGMISPALPNPAATVVVIRAAAQPRDAVFEVLLLRRSPAMSFVAGAHVFPGGRVDEADHLGDVPACCDGLGAPPRFPHLDARGEVACSVAAIRELVEEVGVLLARRGLSWATTDDAETVRRKLREGDSFEQIIRYGGWRLALDALVPFAQVVTPRSEPRRCDTHFFLVELPTGQQARSDDLESDELTWIAPARPLEGGVSGDLALVPPTWMTLMQLALFHSVSALFEWGRARPIVRAEPALTADGEVRLLSIPAAAAQPFSGGAAPMGDLRFAFEEGRGWRPV